MTADRRIRIANWILSSSTGVEDDSGSSPPPTYHPSPVVMPPKTPLEDFPKGEESSVLPEAKPYAPGGRTKAACLNFLTEQFEDLKDRFGPSMWPTMEIYLADFYREAASHVWHHASPVSDLDRRGLLVRPPNRTWGSTPFDAVYLSAEFNQGKGSLYEVRVPRLDLLLPDPEGFWGAFIHRTPLPPYVCYFGDIPPENVKKIR